MSDKAPINRLHGVEWQPNGTFDFQQKDESGGVRQLVADVSELAELQTRLMADDIRSTLVATIKPIIILMVSIATLVGIIPVLLLALANLLVDSQQWEPYMAQFACAGIALLIALSLIGLAYLLFKRCASPLQRSLSELEKNLGSFREMLVGKKVGSDS